LSNNYKMKISQTICRTTKGCSHRSPHTTREAYT
jgi:hypothetical protein